MNEIITSVTLKEKRPGDLLRSKDYDLSPSQMGVIFKTLSDNEIVYRTNTNSYALTDNCVANAQELYFRRIAEIIGQIKTLANAANITNEMLIDVFKNEIHSRN